MWKRPKMQDMTFTIYYAYRPGAEHPRFFNQATSHYTVGGQQVIYRIGIKIIKSLINLIGVLDLGNIFRRSQNTLSIQYSSNLLQREGILLNRQ